MTITWTTVEEALDVLDAYIRQYQKAQEVITLISLKAGAQAILAEWPNATHAICEWSDQGPHLWLMSITTVLGNDEDLDLTAIDDTILCWTNLAMTVDYVWEPFGGYDNNTNKWSFKLATLSAIEIDL